MRIARSKNPQLSNDDYYNSCTIICILYMHGSTHANTINNLLQYSHQHWIISSYITLGQPGGGGSLYPVVIFSIYYRITYKNKSTKYAPHTAAV